MKHDTVLILASTPLHLLDALILASSQASKTQHYHLVLVDQKRRNYYEALHALQGALPFESITLLHLKPRKLLAKIAAKRANYKLLEALTEEIRPDLVITGNDRKIEFDYAMRLARRYRPGVSGAYMDDGLHSYIPQPLKWYQYTPLDTWLQKLLLGRRTPIPRRLGESPLVDRLYLYRPDKACSYLRSKKALPLDSACLQSREMQSALQAIADRVIDIPFTVPKHAALLILPHPSVKKQIAHYSEIIDRCFTVLRPLLLKRHPRDTDTAERMRCEQMPDRGCVVLPSEAAMELLLFLVRPAKVYGLMSSALLTLSWIAPEIACSNIRTDTPYDRLFADEGIPNIDIEEII